MRVVEERMLNAVRNHQSRSLGNTQVVVDGNICKVYLHGNKIYEKNYADGTEMFSNAGWYSNTTRSRLNALGANIYQKNWTWYNYDGTIWVNDF